MKKIWLSSFFLVALTFFFIYDSVVEAKLGVGIGTGKIVVSEKLKPGQIYTLPSVTILNTGDEAGRYGVRISYHEGQKELEPEEDWFVFSPNEFELEPSGAQPVEIKLNLPLNMEPGDYFAYVEGYPTKKADGGVTTIGIAAASKLYFTVEPANYFQAIYYKIISFWNEYQPWTGRITITVAILAIIAVAKKYINIDIKLSNRKKNEPEK